MANRYSFAILLEGDGMTGFTTTLSMSPPLYFAVPIESSMVQPIQSRPSAPYASINVRTFVLLRLN
jgi:hypothetical protein